MPSRSADEDDGWERTGRLVYDDVNDEIDDLGDEDLTVRYTLLTVSSICSSFNFEANGKQ